MSDSIEAISGVSEAGSTPHAALYQQLEMNDVQKLNLSKEVNQTYKSSMQSLAESTGDPAIAGHSST